MSANTNQIAVGQAVATQAKPKKRQTPGQIWSKLNQKAQRASDVAVNFPGLERAVPPGIIDMYVNGARGKRTTRIMRAAIIHISNLRNAEAVFVQAVGYPEYVELKTPSSGRVRNFDESRLDEYRTHEELKALIPEVFLKMVPTMQGELVGRTMRAATYYIGSF